MNETIPKAVAILIDNSATSMDGDFYPTRLQAQILTAIRFSQLLFSGNQFSQVAIGTLSNIESGIRVSFTNSHQKIEDTLSNITSSGCINFLKGIKCAVLALHHCKTNEVSNKRILAFIGNDNDITKKNAKDISSLLSKERIALDLVVIGDSITNMDVLEDIVKSISNDLHSTFLNVKHSNTILSDDVLSSSIGTGPESKILISEYAKKDPEFLTALNISKTPTYNQSPTISMMLQDNNQSHFTNLHEKNSIVKTLTNPKVKRAVSKKKDSELLHTEFQNTHTTKPGERSKSIDKPRIIHPNNQKKK